MNIARILYPVKVLGPGNRVGIWVAGCHRKCPGCSNPELWEKQPNYEISISEFMTIIKDIASHHPVDGFTISGGEPMNQAEELAGLVASLREISPDILIYTGYTLGELRTIEYPAIQTLLTQIGVLVDGPYLEELNDNSLLRGSSNQQIHILDSALEEKYHSYINSATNQIQNFTTTDGVVSVGIHKKGFTKNTA